MNKRKLSLLTVALLMGAAAMGQQKLSPSTRHFLYDHAQTRAVADEMVSAYIHLTRPEADLSRLEALGVKVKLNLGDILTARIPVGAMAEVEALDFVHYIQVGTPVSPMLDKARPAAGVDLIHAGEGLAAGPYTGKGVVIGIVDNGFDYTHPAFYDDARETLRISRVWEQGYDKGTSPEAFGYGSEYKTADEILAIGGDLKTNSHGTHVAAIAAGNNRVDGNPYYGIAYDAELVMVSRGETADNFVDISDAVAYVFDYAKSVGKPCVVNLSLGTMIGPHDGTSSFDQVADRLQQAGCLLVGSSGNHGADYAHASATFTGAEGELPMQVMTAYKQKPSNSMVGGMLDVWGEPGMEFDLKVQIVKESTGEVVDGTELINVSLPEGGSYVTAVSSSCKGNILVTTEINPLNGKPHALIEPKLTSLRMNYALSLQVVPRSAGTVHMWADDIFLQFQHEVPEGWTAGDNNLSNAEIGGTGKQIISVGAYCTRDKYPVYGTSREDATGHTLHALADFSGVGPTLDGRMKPDIAAPGTFIASAINSHDTYYASFPQASEVIWNNNLYRYSFMQGTSMSSPFVAGTVATWLQANPQLTPADVRAILEKTAVKDEYTAVGFGYGKLDSYAGLKEAIARASSIGDAPLSEAGSGVVVSVDGTLCRLLFTAAAPQTVAVVTNAAGAVVCTQPVSGVAAGDEVTISLQGLEAGLYIVSVNGTAHKLLLR